MNGYEKIALKALETLFRTDLSDDEKEKIYSDLVSQKKYPDNIRELEKVTSDFIRGYK